jgi:hypothetical protein
MKLIDQEDPTGCGIACVAMVAASSYARAKRAIFMNRKPKKWYTFWPQLRRGMDHLGVEYEDRALRTTKLETIKRTAIVGVGGGPCTPDSHWVVYDPRSGLVYDPCKKYKSPRKASEFGKQERIYSYLYVSKA